MQALERKRTLQWTDNSTVIVISFSGKFLEIFLLVKKKRNRSGITTEQS
jgi:hypothetical protein